MNSLFVCVQLRDIQKDCNFEAYSLKCWELKKKLCMNIACICDFKNVSYCYLSLLLPAPVRTLQALHTWTFCPGLRICRYMSQQNVCVGLDEIVLFYELCL